jgi:hypothetical protein
MSRADLRLTVHRLTGTIGTIGWLPSDDWDESATLPPALATRIHGWHAALVRYLKSELPKL